MVLKFPAWLHKGFYETSVPLINFLFEKYKKIVFAVTSTVIGKVTGELCLLHTDWSFYS